MRLRKVDEWKIDYLLGHTGRIPGIYTDWTMMIEDMREVMDETLHQGNSQLFVTRVDGKL
jgi:hypothetical protein